MEGIAIKMSKNDTHPIGGLLVFGNPTKVVNVIGLKKSRGDNMVYVSNVNNDVRSTVRSYGMRLADIDSDELGFDGNGFDDDAIVIGVSRNVRDTMNWRDYVKMIKDIASKIGTGRTVNVCYDTEVNG